MGIFLAWEGRSVRHRIKERRRPECAPVDGRVAESAHGLEVFLCGIPFVPVETVSWILRVQFPHEPVARDLRQYRGRCDRRRTSVTAWNGPLCHQEVGDAKAIDDHKSRQRLEGH